MTVQTTIEDFEILSKLGKQVRSHYIGEGSFSEVYLARRKSDQQEYGLNKVSI